MSSFKNIMQHHGDQQLKKSLTSSPISAQSERDSNNKTPQQCNSDVMQQSDSKDSIGKNLTQRIKKAKDQIFVQSNQRKGYRKDKQILQESVIEEDEDSLSNVKVAEPKKGMKVNKLNDKINRILNDNDYKINIIKDDNFNIQHQLYLQQQHQNKLQDNENQQQSDVNSNQIECSESNADQEEEEDPFIDDYIQQNNNPYTMKIPVIGGNEAQKLISIVFNKSEGGKETVKQQRSRQKKRKENINDPSQTPKMNENSNSTTKYKKRNSASQQLTEPKPKREYKKKSKKVENSEQDGIMKHNSQVKNSGLDHLTSNQFNLNLLSSNITQNTQSNSNSTTPKDKINKNIIIQNYANGQNTNQTNVCNENYNSSNSHAQTSSATQGGGSSSNKKGFRQYNKDTKIPSAEKSDVNNNSQPTIDQEGLISLFLQVQGLQAEKGYSNINNLQTQNQDTFNSTLEALLQNSTQATPITSTPNANSVTKKKSKSELKIKPFQEENNQSADNVTKSTQKQKIQQQLSSKNMISLFQEPSSVNCRLNMDIETKASEQYDQSLPVAQPTQAAPIINSSSKKKQKLHAQNQQNEKSEEKPKKKVKTSQEDIGFGESSMVSQQTGLSSTKKSKKDKKQKEIIPEQTFKQSQITNVTKTDNSLVVQLVQSTEDSQQIDIEKQIEEFSFTKEVIVKQKPEEKKAEQENLKNSKVFNILWEKQMIYKRKMELYQLSSFERYQQHKIQELKQNFKSATFYLPTSQMHEKISSDKNEETETITDFETIKASNQNNQVQNLNQNLFSRNDQQQENHELSFSKHNNSQPMVEEEEEEEENQRDHDVSYKNKSTSALLEDRNDQESHIKQEEENPETKRSAKKTEKEEGDSRDYQQKFQDLRNKFLLLKQTFKPSIITA